MNDTIIFLVLAGLALLFRWLTNLASARENDAEESPPNEQRQPPRRHPAQSEEERVRKFLEALGVPSGQEPPPPPPPRPTRTPKVRRGLGPPLPPITSVPPEPVVLEAGPPPAVDSPPPLPATPLSVPVTSLPPISARKPLVPRAVPAASVSKMLRTRGSIRQAIILREVLGPPRGVQALEELRH